MTSPTKAATNTRSRAVAWTDEEAGMTEAGPSSLNTAPADQLEPPKEKQKNGILPPWPDIPHWRSSRSPLMNMPLEIWDKVCPAYLPDYP